MILPACCGGGLFAIILLVVIPIFIAQLVCVFALAHGLCRFLSDDPRWGDYLGTPCGLSAAYLYFLGVQSGRLFHPAILEHMPQELNVLYVLILAPAMVGTLVGTVTPLVSSWIRRRLAGRFQ